VASCLALSAVEVGALTAAPVSNHRRAIGQRGHRRSAALFSSAAARR